MSSPAYAAVSASAYGGASYVPGGPVGYQAPGGGLVQAVDLIPVQLPNPAINDLEITTVNMTVVLIATQSGGGRPGPAALDPGNGILLQNNIPFLQFPMQLAFWGFGSVFPNAPLYTFTGTITPTTPFPIYQSDRFQMAMAFSVNQPIPQDGGGAPPVGSDFQYRMVDPAEAIFVNQRGNYSFTEFIGTLTAKDDLF